MRAFLLMLVIAGFGLLATGCATSEPANQSARPWNSPKGWEHGFSGFNEGR